MAEPIKKLGHAHRELWLLKNETQRVRVARNHLAQILRTRNERLLEARRAGATHQELADAMGMSRQRVSSLLEVEIAAEGLTS